jgi:feruloyl esterase
MSRIVRYASLASGGALLAAALLIPTAQPRAQSGPSACASLVGLALPDATIVAATDVTAPYTTSTAAGSSSAVTVTGPFPFCRVEAVLTPSSDSQIQTEVWIPRADRWNGKFVGVGNGALSGSIWHTSMVRPLGSGYAVAGSNLGHAGGASTFAVGHPERVVDYAHRADHVVSVFAKAVINAYHGSGPSRSYFHGCSNGGHQALMEAQRYPDDYDGIIAGAPWNHWTHQIIEFISRSLALEHFNPAKRALVTAAVIEQCGGRDGGLQEDGYLNTPLTCQFKPKSLLCEGGDAADCLTADEVTALEQIYQGPVHAATGRSLFPGFDPGAETWSGLGAFVTSLFRNMVFDDPASTWDFHQFDFNHDVALFDAKLAALINSNNADMRAYRDRGGKLIMWHGWADSLLEARSTLNFYNSVVAVTGANLDLDELQQLGKNTGAIHAKRRQRLAETQEWFRLYMTPGVAHCGGGPGPSSTFAYTLGNPAGPNDPDYDALAALDRWVETGIAPGELIASHFTAGVADKTRPLCVYPQILSYGGGDPARPESFSCVNDWSGFNRDFTHELQNIMSNIRNGTMHNMPN